MTGLIDKTQRSVGQFQVGPIGYGLWRFTDANVDAGQKRIEVALGQGMNLIDVADVYGYDGSSSGFGRVERQLGRVLAQTPGLRSQMVLATKGGITPPRPYDSSKSYLIEACENSLQRLQTDVIDIYQIHRPDMYTHPEEVADALTTLREAGKIREAGVSNYTPQQTAALVPYLPFPLVSQQPEFSALQLDPLRNGVLDQCMERKMVPLAWSPLAGGRIPRGSTDVPKELLSVLDQLGEREGVTRSSVALGFILAHPSKPVCIIGTQNSERIREMARDTSITLDRHDVYRIIQASDGKPLP